MRLQPLRHVLKRTAAVVRRHHADNDFHAGEGLLEIVGCRDGSGQRKAGKKQIIRARSGNALQHFFFQGPKADLMVVAAARHHGQGRAPGARADDRDPAQSVFSTGVDLPPRRFSVPARRRPMF